jgi:hypothetical protein
MFDKDITVINRYVDETRATKYKLSYIHGFWSSNDGISISGTNLVKTDGVSARILMSEPKYQNPKEFLESQKGWTLKNDDYLVKGIITNFTTITDLIANTSDVMKIKNIATKDYGSEDMWHWAITGE